MSIFRNKFNQLRFGWFATYAIIAVTIVIYSACTFCLHIAFPAELEKIEELRTLAGECVEAEDIRGLIAERNMYIRAQQKYNHMWWSGLATPDAWDEVEPIQIPDCR